MYRLSFLDGRLKGRDVTVSEPRLVIGHAPECGLRLLADGIAPLHAELADEGGRVSVRRLDATAVLAIGSAPVGGELAPLNPGDVLTLGPLRLRLHSAAVTPLPSSDSRRVSPMATFAAIAVALMFAAEIAWLVRAASRSSQAAVAAALAEARQQRKRTPPAAATATGGPSDRAENPKL